MSLSVEEGLDGRYQTKLAGRAAGEEALTGFSEARNPLVQAPSLLPSPIDLRLVIDKQVDRSPLRHQKLLPSRPTHIR